MKWLFSIVLFLFISVAQEKQQPDEQIKKESHPTPASRINQQGSNVVTVFKNVEHGIQKCTVKDFTKELGTMVSISIGSAERGFFSVNQAASVLSGFFSGRKPISFEFSRINEKGAAPYATGRFLYVHRGSQESVQVYVSLT